MTQFSLADLGWSDHFARQIDPGALPARINAIHRDRVEALTPDGAVFLTTPNETGTYAVGDWVTHDGRQVVALLKRLSIIERRAAGETARRQLIAANVDTLAIVTSCNADFNPARLERYLTLATASGARPLVILTKADQCDDPEDYRQQAEDLSPLVTAIALDARDPEVVQILAPWCKAGQTMALLGSSGVGKTTLQNHLTGGDELTKAMRVDDAKGRHTTTARALRPTLNGGWLIDTPGMRELRLTDVAEGIETVFDDVTELAANCRFSDCAHETEPGCAVQAAIAEGMLEVERLTRWRKLQRENRHNTETVAETRSRGRKMGRLSKESQSRQSKRPRSR